MAVSDKQIKAFIQGKLGLQRTEGNKEIFDQVLELRIQHEREYWLKEYAAMIDLEKFKDEQQMPLVDVFKRLKSLTDHSVAGGIGMNEIMCRIKVNQNKIIIQTDLDAAEFIAEK